MDSVIQAIYDWIKEILVAGVMDNLTCIFDGVNMQVGAVASQVGTSPAAFQPAVFRLIQNLSDNVITPIAGLYRKDRLWRSLDLKKARV